MLRAGLHGSTSAAGQGRSAAGADVADVPQHGSTGADGAPLQPGSAAGQGSALSDGGGDGGFGDSGFDDGGFEDGGGSFSDEDNMELNGASRRQLLWKRQPPCAATNVMQKSHNACGRLSTCSAFQICLADAEAHLGLEGPAHVVKTLYYMTGEARASFGMHPVRM